MGSRSVPVYGQMRKGRSAGGRLDLLAPNSAMTMGGQVQRSYKPPTAS